MLLPARPGAPDSLLVDQGFMTLILTDFTDIFGPDRIKNHER